MQVAVIGGGCAGLAAAADLAARGIPVTLFEAAKHLGGRARGLDWNGARLDNGQHILIGAYRDTLRLMALAGVDTEAALRRWPLQLIQQDGFHLRAARHLPAPLHILVGLLRAEGLRRRERLAALRLMARLRLTRFRIAHDLPLDEFLTHYKQPENVVRWLWEPLCLAALNTPLAQASTQVFLNVLRDSFAGCKDDSDLLLPRRDLSALLAEPLGRYIVAQGGSVHVGTAISGIATIPSGFRLATAHGEQAFTHVILAVPPFRAAELLSDLPALAEQRRLINELDYQPIATVYLQYAAQARLPHPMIGLAHGHAQWVLDRGQLDGQQGLLAAVISAHGPYRQLAQEDLAAAVAQELASAFPHLPSPLWHKVIIEKRATLACTPSLRRPEHRTPLPNFYLAGDYTAGDYPATIEGAVRSGLACAELIVGA